LKRFSIACTIVAIILCGTGFLMLDFHLIDNLPSFFWEIQIFVISTTFFLFRYLYRVAREQFVQLYLLTMVVKLLGYGGFAVFVILEDRANASLNVAFFLISYLVFTLLELGFLYPKINR